MKKSSVMTIFKQLIAYQSVSTDPGRHNEMIETAQYIQKQLADFGFEVEILELKGASPLIFAYYKTSPQHKTIALYAHYDVQPEDPITEWQTQPFVLTSKDNKLFGRGVADDKASIIQILAALSELIENKTLNNNIVVIFEGEEEIGSVNFEAYMKSLKSQLSDVAAFYILDSGLFKKNVPQILYGLRGLVSFELTVKTARRDLHSGSYGNKVLNAAHVAASIVSQLKDPLTNRVSIPGFYDEVRKITETEKKLLTKIERSDVQEMEEATVKKLTTIDNIGPTLISKIYPSLDINGIFSGYTGRGVKTIIPSQATIKFTCRLVENQKPKIIQKLVLAYVKTLLPEGVDYTLKSEEAIEPFYCSLDNEFIKHTAKMMTKQFGHETLYNRSGGSIPAAEILQRLFGKPVIVTGFSMPDSNLHSPNENINEVMFWKGTETLKALFSEN